MNIDRLGYRAADGQHAPLNILLSSYYYLSHLTIENSSKSFVIVSFKSNKYLLLLCGWHDVNVMFYFVITVSFHLTGLNETTLFLLAKQMLCMNKFHSTWSKATIDTFKMESTVGFMASVVYCR